MEWIDIKSGELPKEDCEVEAKLKSGEIVEDAYYSVEWEGFSYMFGNFYHAKKENEFREYNICHDKFTGDIATHYRITPTVIKEEKK